MPDHDLSVLDVLKCELYFLGRGGYKRATQTWRAPLIFEDSPTCKNYYCEGKEHPCSECLLQGFVPSEMKDREVPCRYIPLNDKGDTLDSLYHFAYEPEIEKAVASWLRSTIDKLEAESAGQSEANVQIG